MPCVKLDANTIICFGGGKEIETAKRRRKWCFGCRKRLSHRLSFTDDAWYDPEPVWRCVGCGKDETRFPGR